MSDIFGLFPAFPRSSSFRHTPTHSPHSRKLHKPCAYTELLYTARAGPHARRNEARESGEKRPDAERAPNATDEDETPRGRCMPMQGGGPWGERGSRFLAERDA
jgi:hypothetical protein